MEEPRLHPDKTSRQTALKSLAVRRRIVAVVKAHVTYNRTRCPLGNETFRSIIRHQETVTVFNRTFRVVSPLKAAADLKCSVQETGETVVSADGQVTSLCAEQRGSSF